MRRFGTMEEEGKNQVINDWNRFECDTALDA